MSRKLCTRDFLAIIKDAASGVPPLIQRSYKPVTHVESPTNSVCRDSSIRVMQWNILADALSAGKDNFVRCPPKALEWSGRRLQLLQEILLCDPDVLTLQEVDHFGFFKHSLGSCGYEGYFYPKPDSPALYVNNNNGPDGVAMFIKSDVFETVSIDKVILKKIPDLGDTNQVSIIANLKVKNTGKEIGVATTHLKAKSGWAELRHSQGLYLAEYLLKNIGHKPLILCGDFNAEPAEKVYSVFSQSPLNLGSVYKDTIGGGHEPPYTTWKIRGDAKSNQEKEVKRTIDYIWYSKEKLQPVAVLEIPTEEQIGEHRLPSFSYPSDHLSLGVDFIID